jgi:hypothetical protein
MRYKGGIISANLPTVTTSSAKGIWTLNDQAQYKKEGVWPEIPPTTIGQAYGGGFYAGKIAVGGGGIATHYLIVAPKATGEASKSWDSGESVVTGFNSYINGPANSAGEAALGAGYLAATFCEGLTIGGYTDWYFPARNELEVLYYFLKPTTNANNTGSGQNANAVSPEPISTNYTSGSPAQTSAGIGFRTGETNAFVSNYYISSTEEGYATNLGATFLDGRQTNFTKSSIWYVRAVRRVPI